MAVAVEEAYLHRQLAAMVDLVVAVLLTDYQMLEVLYRQDAMGLHKVMLGVLDITLVVTSGVAVEEVLLPAEQLDK